MEIMSMGSMGKREKKVPGFEGELKLLEVVSRLKGPY